MSDTAPAGDTAPAEPDSLNGWTVIAQDDTTISLVNNPRSMKLRIMDVGDLLDLLEAAGDAAGKSGWMNFAQAICSVRELDGVPVPAPGTNKAAIKRSGSQIGMERVSVALWALFQRRQTSAASVQAAKN